MGYALSLSPLAERQFRSQPEPLRTFIGEALARLAASPGSLSRPTTIITRGQVAEFRFEPAPDHALWVTVTFLYGSDEQTLHVEHIAAEFGA